MFSIVVENSLDAHVIYLAFSLPFDEISQEYMVYNFGRIAAAVGGAAGLFLGVSLFQIVSWIIDASLGRDLCFGNSQKKSGSAGRSNASSGSHVVKVKPINSNRLK